MSYECNQIVTYLSKTALFSQPSKSSKSVYFYFKGFNIRYSDHWTLYPRKGYIQVVRKAREVWIMFPGEDGYREFSERSAYYRLRRVIRESTQTVNEKTGRSAERYQRWKNRRKEGMRMKKYLRGLSGMDLKNHRLESPESLIYVDKYKYLP